MGKLGSTANSFATQWSWLSRLDSSKYSSVAPILVGQMIAWALSERQAVSPEIELDPEAILRVRSERLAKALEDIYADFPMNKKNALPVYRWITLFAEVDNKLRTRTVRPASGVADSGPRASVRPFLYEATVNDSSSWAGRLDALISYSDSPDYARYVGGFFPYIPPQVQTSQVYSVLIIRVTPLLDASTMFDRYASAYSANRLVSCVVPVMVPSLRTRLSKAKDVETCRRSLLAMLRNADYSYFDPTRELHGALSNYFMASKEFLRQDAALLNRVFGDAFSKWRERLCQHFGVNDGAQDVWCRQPSEVTSETVTKLANYCLWCDLMCPHDMDQLREGECWNAIYLRFERIPGVAGRGVGVNIGFSEYPNRKSVAAWDRVVEVLLRHDAETLAIDRARTQQREKLIAYASHTVSGPSSDPLLYLSLAEKGIEVQENIKRARMRIVRLRRNAQTILSLKAMEGSAENVAPVDVNLAELVGRYLAEVTEDWALRCLPALNVCQNIEDVILSTRFPDLLEVLLVTLIGNAVESIEAAFGKWVVIQEPPLEVRGEQCEQGVVVEIENGGVPVTDDEVRRLNETDYTKESVRELSRKGPGHYGMGVPMVKWMASRLDARVSYTNHGGRCVVALRFKG